MATQPTTVTKIPATALGLYLIFKNNTDMKRIMTGWVFDKITALAIDVLFTAKTQNVIAEVFKSAIIKNIL
jgi:hypothetical protein